MVTSCKRLFRSPECLRALFLFTFVCNVYCVPPPTPMFPNLCPQENIPSDQVQPWPNNIILFTMSGNLTVNSRREILRVMSVWERRMCDSITFIPHNEQAEEREDFVSFVPGERCCSNLGKTCEQRQKVYVDGSCILDRTLEDVIGMLIGNTQQTTNEGEGGCKGRNATYSKTSGPGESEPNISNTTSNSGDRDTNVRHITGKVTGRTRRGNIYSPNYPLEYASNTECIWKITVPENAALRLRFEDFDTECFHDYLEIHHVHTEDGTTTSSERLCGNLTGRGPITSHILVDMVILRFHTDVTYNRGGFNISYEFIENEHQCEIDNGGCSYMCETDSSGIGNCKCQEGFRVNRSGGCRDINECHTNTHGCEQNCQNTPGSFQCSCNEGYALYIDQKHCTRCKEVYNATQGIIEPTGYPGPYHNHQNCLYTIFIHPEHILKLTLLVDIQYSTECKKEFLKMEHGYFKYNRRLCHYISNVSYYIRDSNVTSTTLRFRTRNLNSNSAFQSSGFSVQFQQVLRSTVSDTELNTVQVGPITKQYNMRPWLNYPQ